MIELALAALANPCGALLLRHPVQAIPSGVEARQGACVSLDGDLAGRAQWVTPEIGLGRTLELPRARGELAALGGPVSGRLAVAAVRSGGDTGYIGVDGEAFVPRIDVAEVRVDWSAVGLAAAAGIVDDPWVASGDRLWEVRSVAPGLGEGEGWLDRADVGGWVGWAAPGLAATVAYTSGEGHRRRERNNGQDLTFFLNVRPLRLAGAPDVLEVSMFGRDGSRGIELARDHRLGARVALDHELVVAGVEGLMGWGARGDAELTPGGVSIWARTGLDLPAVGWARVDFARQVRASADTGTTTWMLGGGARVGPREDGRATVDIVVGYQGRSYAEGAGPLAGTEQAAAVHTFFVQIGGRLRVAAPVLLSVEGG